MIRRLGPGDAALWRAIRLEALAMAPEAFSARLADWRGRPIEDFAAQIAASPTFLAVDEDRPVGSVTWMRDGDPACPWRGWIGAVFVSADMRGRGLGGALIEAAVADAAQSGMREMWLEVGAANAVARRAYARSGFAEVQGPDRPSRSCGTCEISMWRALTWRRVLAMPWPGALPPSALARGFPRGASAMKKPGRPGSGRRSG